MDSLKPLGTSGGRTGRPGCSSPVGAGFDLHVEVQLGLRPQYLLQRVSVVRRALHATRPLTWLGTASECGGAAYALRTGPQSATVVPARGITRYTAIGTTENPGAWAISAKPCAAISSRKSFTIAVSFPRLIR